MLKQKGNSTVIGLGAASVFAIGAASFSYESEVQKPIQQAHLANEEIVAIQEAASKYRLEFGDWPESMDELVDGVNYSGPRKTPFGSMYQLVIDDDVLSVKMDTYSKYAATTMQGLVRGGSRLDDDTITSSINPPPESTATTYLLAKKELDCSPECNTLEANIDANGNEISNLKRVDSESAEFDSADIEKSEIKRLAIEEYVDIGENSRIASGAGGLVITGPVVKLNGDVRINGDLNMSNNDISNVKRLEAVDIEAVTAAIENAEVDKLKGEELLYAVGVIDSLSGKTLTYDTAFLSEVVADEASFKQFQVDVLNAISANFSSAMIQEATAKLVSSEQWQTQSLTVTGVANISSANVDYLEVIEAVSEVVTAETVRASNTVTEYLDTEDLNVSGIATMSETYASQIDAAYADLRDFYAKSFIVDNDITVKGQLTANSANITNQTTTKKLVVDETSELGRATAESLNVSGKVTAQSVNAQTANVDGDLSATNIDGQRAVFNRVVADDYQGGMFYGDNFVTPITSTNKNHELLMKFKDNWNKCVEDMNCK